MPQTTGKTYGFGRVSPRYRPSPYTPVHLSSVAPGVVPHGEVASRSARSRGRRLAGVLTIVFVVAASAFAAAGLLRAASPSRDTAHGPAAPGSTLVARDDEAERVGRSALAMPRRHTRP